jgi:hypothetical protein
MARVTRDGTLTARVPPDVPPGEHRVVLALEDGPAAGDQRPPLDFPVDDWGAWPEGLSLRRKDLYGDWGQGRPTV